MVQKLYSTVRRKDFPIVSIYKSPVKLILFTQKMRHTTVITLYLFILDSICSSSVHQEVPENSFSGIYEAIFDEQYTASWLISSDRFLSSYRQISRIGNLEGATFEILELKCKNCRAVFTRDFFDFNIEHLSSGHQIFPMKLI